MLQSKDILENFLHFWNHFAKCHSNSDVRSTNSFSMKHWHVPHFISQIVINFQTNEKITNVFVNGKMQCMHSFKWSLIERKHEIAHAIFAFHKFWIGFCEWMCMSKMNCMPIEIVKKKPSAHACSHQHSQNANHWLHAALAFQFWKFWNDLIFSIHFSQKMPNAFAMVPCMVQYNHLAHFSSNALLVRPIGKNPNFQILSWKAQWQFIEFSKKQKKPLKITISSNKNSCHVNFMFWALFCVSCCIANWIGHSRSPPKISFWHSPTQYYSSGKGGANAGECPICDLCNNG